MPTPNKTESRKLRGLSDLESAPYNPRTIDAAAMDGLKRSLAEFGDLSGIVWNARTGHLVAGHQRLRGLKERFGGGLELRLTPTPHLFAADTEWPIRVVEWDENTERLANITANNPHIAGTFTDELRDVVDSIELDPEIMEALRVDELLLEQIDAAAVPRTDDLKDYGEFVGFKFGDFGGRVRIETYRKFAAKVQHLKGGTDGTIDDVITRIIGDGDHN